MNKIACGGTRKMKYLGRTKTSSLSLVDQWLFYRLTLLDLETNQLVRPAWWITAKYSSMMLTNEKMTLVPSDTEVTNSQWPEWSKNGGCQTKRRKPDTDIATFNENPQHNHNSHIIQHVKNKNRLQKFIQTEIRAFNDSTWSQKIADLNDNPGSLPKAFNRSPPLQSL